MALTVNDVLNHKHGTQEKKEERWLGSPVCHCQVCQLDIRKAEFVDGRTRFGPWAIMCLGCWRDQGFKLGTGTGQKYSVDRRKVAG